MVGNPSPSCAPHHKSDDESFPIAPFGHHWGHDLHLNAAKEENILTSDHLSQTLGLEVQSPLRPLAQFQALCPMDNLNHTDPGAAANSRSKLERKAIFQRCFSWLKGWERKNLTKKMLIWLLFPNIGEAGYPQQTKIRCQHSQKPARNGLIALHRWQSLLRPAHYTAGPRLVKSTRNVKAKKGATNAIFFDKLAHAASKNLSHQWDYDHKTNPWCHWKSICMTYSSPPRSWGRLGCLETASFSSTNINDTMVQECHTNPRLSLSPKREES